MKTLLLILSLSAAFAQCPSDHICSQATDAGFSGGTLWSASLTSPLVRFGNAFSYQRFVPNGLYVVTLYFVEPNVSVAGQRVFDVRINDALTYSRLDVFAIAKAVGKVIKRAVVVPVVDGVVKIDFATANGRAAVVSAIRIAPLGIGIEEAQ